MTPTPVLEPETQPAALDTSLAAPETPKSTGALLRRLWGGTLVVVGYLLSPLCWWNDLVINLPLALGFGYLVSRPWPDALVPLTGVGYWLTNVVGFVLMQQGAVTALQKEGEGSKTNSLRNGLITSTVYTVAIVVLVQFHILEMPDFLNGDLMATLDKWLPDWLMG
ncbi:hypothetical protein PGN35_011600 [Nodosilinea sp. PGN35]|uniref:hypothetical protein n=1 Tax=Nodosilinea sp. PGN35 TaxID=3020489 RepID=UPI0023B2B5BF|nr:hypothetical protein [Nodosilinea sp. TSF1-S3]MDF0366324.1 hypothetical protein [Nodosilinea sp. TSF1-S3]